VSELCGIVGITSKKGAGVLKDLISSLTKLEYRGYDSAGIAILTDKGIEVIKGVGTISEVVSRALDEIKDGSTGIGHTRWATHGEVSEQNAHPLLSCDRRVAVVHNGTLDDFEKLRDRLMAKGHRFSSDTDSEVIAHLIEENITLHGDIVEAFVKTVMSLKGSYAVAAIIQGYNALLVARNKSPLVVGLGNGENYCASDVAALLHKTNRFIFLEDGDIALVTPDTVKVCHLTSTGEALSVERGIELIEWSPELLSRGSYEHFMLKEIHEQPNIIRKIAENLNYYRKFAEALFGYLRDGSLSIVAAGTSYHAGLIGKYLFSKMLSVRSEVIIASEFQEWSHHLRKGDIVLAISQSGETADVLEAVRIARSRGTRVLSLVNVPGSTLTRLSDEVAYIQAGPEVGVAATKTFTAQIAVLYLISSIMKDLNEGKIRENTERSLLSVSKILNGQLDEFKRRSKDISERIKHKKNAFFLGRGINFPTALEGALKLKEISYIHAEGYPAGEYKHGPLALIEEGVPAIVLVPYDEDLRRKIIYNLMEVKSRGALTITVQPDNVDVPTDFAITTDSSVGELLSPLIYAVPLQLIAYYTAVSLNRNPDKPRNLAKSVTVE